MNEGETFKQLDKPPVEQAYLELGDLTSQLRQVNVDTLHRLTDVLNPIANEMSKIIKHSAQSILNFSETHKKVNEQIESMGDDLAEVGRTVAKEVQEAITSAGSLVKDIRDITAKSAIARLAETFLLCMLTTLAAIFLYMRFLS